MNVIKKIFHIKEKKVKLGLALGSGGAKGFAELGALKAFNEHGIEFDYIAGTSIGSIIGAFYSAGYSLTDIMELMKKVDMGDVTNMFMIKMDTFGMFKVIDDNLGNLEFSDLKKPFSAIATEIETGNEKVFSSGSVAKALCASSSYPPFFKAVEIDGEKYVDGAFSNSVPADCVKRMGADYIVGIDLSNHTLKSKPSILSMFLPKFTNPVSEPWAKGYEYSNVMLKPDLSKYTPLSIKSGMEMFEIGYLEALKHIPKIKSDIKNYKHKRKK